MLFVLMSSALAVTVWPVNRSLAVKFMDLTNNTLCPACEDEGLSVMLKLKVRAAVKRPVLAGSTEKFQVNLEVEGSNCTLLTSEEFTLPFTKPPEARGINAVNTPLPKLLLELVKDNVTL